MTDSNAIPKVVVGVDGSAASVEALRLAHRLAGPLGAVIEATACWEYPRMYDSYVSVGIEEFEGRAAQIIDEAVAAAFGSHPPADLTTRLVEGSARSVLIEASRDAVLLVVGRRGHGGFGGLLVGSVSSACVAHGHCPVLVVHAPSPVRGS